MPQPTYFDPVDNAWAHSPPIADVPTGIGATAADNAAAINAILAALRSANVVGQG